MKVGNHSLLSGHLNYPKISPSNRLLAVTLFLLYFYNHRGVSQPNISIVAGYYLLNGKAVYSSDPNSGANMVTASNATGYTAT